MRRSGLGSVACCVTSGVSVVCMSSMAAALAAAGAAVGAGAAGVGSMGTMGGLSAEGGASSFLPGLFERLGLAFLNALPNEVLQPLLVVLLTVSVGASYLAYRGHRRLPPLGLALVAAPLMYASIYVGMSDPLYLASLAGLLGSGLWGLAFARRPTRPA